jgi:hypothetical protein
MGKKKKKDALINGRTASYTERKSILKKILPVASFVVFFLVLVVATYKYTNVFKFWERILFGDPIDKYIEQKETERLEMYSQYMSNKKELSREVRLDLLIAIKRFNKICKKYLIPREYNLYLMLDYISEHRQMTKEEKLMLWYFFEKVRKKMIPGEAASIYKDMEVIERLKGELKEIQAKKQENK